MVNSLIEMCRIPAIAPESGGDGEAVRAEYLLKLLSELGFDKVEVIKVDDARVSAGYRPNIIVTIPGDDRSLPPLWVVSHMDIVPEGDRGLWDTDPYQPVVKDGKLYGRGVEDNGQSLMASIYAAKALMNAGLKPKRDLKLALVADEEVGSARGLVHLADKGLFKKEDLIVVPDAGTSDGSAIEVVEKSHLQFKVLTRGKQGHASRPHKSLNAFRAASKFVSRISDELYANYPEQDELFSPPFSTFEATKKEANVPNINTIPGDDVFYMDCRILPTQSLEEIMDFVHNVAKEVEEETEASIFLENVSLGEAPPATSVNSEVVRNLQKAIKQIRGVDAKPVGIGGGTCAAIVRKKGLEAAVWSTSYETAHEPNENISIDNLVSDAKVFALLYQM